MRRPTAAELAAVQKPDGNYLRISDEILANLRHVEVLNFGHLLLNDTTSMKRIIRDHRNDDEMIVYDVFKNWLARDDDNRKDPAYPRTWRALAYCLEATSVELGALVNDLRKHFD